MNAIKNAFVLSVITLALLCGYVSAADAGCRISYSFYKSDDSNFHAVHDFSVLSKGGTWKHVWRFPHHRDVRKSRGNKYKDIYKATFKCKAKRRYRYNVCGENVYYPSATGWTTKTNINFGDISRHCK